MSLQDYDKRYKLSDEEREGIIKMRLVGNTQRQIGERYGIGQPYVSRLLAAHFEEQERS